jgi:hypothetical protein
MRHGSTRTSLLLALACCGLVAPAARSDDIILPDSMLGAQVAPLLLLTRVEVRSELGLTDEQWESARQTIAELHEQAKALMGRGNGPDVIARRRVIDDAGMRWISATLSSEQRSRLGQIDLQWQGLGALVRPMAVELLGLNEEQVGKVRKALAEPPKGPPDRAWAERVLAVLTADQRAHWKSVLGKPVPFIATATRTTDTAVGPASGNKSRK